jgi:hypothetical protein
MPTPRKPRPKLDRQSAMVARTIASADAVADRRDALNAGPAVGAIANRKLRTLALVALLLRHRSGLTVEQLREALSVSRATLYRMRDDLIAASLPLAIAERGGVGVWSLDLSA